VVDPAGGPAKAGLVDRRHLGDGRQHLGRRHLAPRSGPGERGVEGLGLPVPFDHVGQPLRARLAGRGQRRSLAEVRVLDPLDRLQEPQWAQPVLRLVQRRRTRQLQPARRSRLGPHEAELVEAAHGAARRRQAAEATRHLDLAQRRRIAAIDDRLDDHVQHHALELVQLARALGRRRLVRHAPAP
jgi:hypothetical protein